MQVKTSELSGAYLDYFVDKCQGKEDLPFRPKYSTDWTYSGPIIEREGINLSFHHQTKECAATDLKLVVCIWGKTPLIAAMRCYVASKLGDVVDIPDELMESLK